MVCIRIVANFGSRIFQFTTTFIASYNVHIYYYFGYYFYTLLPTDFSFRKLDRLEKTYSFTIFGLCGGCSELAKTESAKICVGLFYESDLQVKFKI